MRGPKVCRSVSSGRPGELRDGRVGREGATHRLLKRGEDEALAMKAHVRLRRVYVHVHVVIGESNVDDCDRESSLHQEAPVRLFQRVSERSALHPATVDERY